MAMSDASRAVVVTVDNVSRHVDHDGGSTTMLAPVSAQLRAGTLVVLAGPSGSGKTTFCNIVLGWDRTDTGAVHWEDTDARGWARLSVSPQRLALLPALTVRENILFPSWAAGRSIANDDLSQLAGRLEIDTLLHRRPTELSFGEQQRASVARTVLGNPRVAVLDEPTGHQDERRTACVIDALLAARSQGACVLVATHDADLIDAADEVVTLQSVLVRR